jgi:hypothetical protein
MSLSNAFTRFESVKKFYRRENDRGNYAEKRRVLISFSLCDSSSVVKNTSKSKKCTSNVYLN